MAQDDVRNPLPEELAAVDELARLLEQYQTYLLAGSGFAESVRAQASNAAGTARPTLERLHPKGNDGVVHLEHALRRAQNEEDGKVVLEDVGAALKEIRALLAGARLRRHAPAYEIPAVSVASATAATAVPVVQPPAKKPEIRERRSNAWIWVGSGLAAGLVLGAFGRTLPQSSGALQRLWHVLEPIIATGSGAHIGNVLFHVMDGEPIRDTLRRRWVGIMVSLLLLIMTAPTAVDAAKDLLGPQQVEQRAAPVETHAPAEKPVTPPATAAQPVVSPAPAQPVQSTPQAPAKSADEQKATTSASASSGPAVPAASAPRPRGSRPPECDRLLERMQIGDELTAQERAFFRTQCGS
jgi:hypothetical protein